MRAASRERWWFGLTETGQEGRQLDGHHWSCPDRDRCAKEGCSIDAATSSKACAEEEVDTEELSKRWTSFECYTTVRYGTTWKGNRLRTANTIRRKRMIPSQRYQPESPFRTSHRSFTILNTYITSLHHREQSCEQRHQHALTSASPTP